MMYFADESVDRWIKEDVPYLDLTSFILDISGKKGKIEFNCREDAVVCGTEEVIRIFDKLKIKLLRYLPSGSKVGPQTSIIEGEGNAEDLYQAWKVSMNILEYASGIASRTNRILNKARRVNPKINIFTTRKVFPGTKELAIKAVLAGGGLPHRLGLSETILIFKQHLNLIGGVDGLVLNLDELKAKACEKKVVVETETLEEALLLSRAGVDGLQFDKMSPPELSTVVKAIRADNHNIVLLAAGGINEANSYAYAETGVDGLVTSAVYFGKPVDMGTRITAN
ncbi:MAG: ModD protein [Desulfosporosinus sp.]|jgi:molybdenum transport protein